MEQKSKARIREYRQRHDQKRGSAHDRGYDQAWAEARLWYLRQPENAFCACGCGKPSECVDHIEGFNGPSDPKRLDPLNFQAMTIACNSQKAVMYEKDHRIRDDLSAGGRGAIKKMLRLAAYRAELIERRDGVCKLSQPTKKRYVVCGLQASGKTTWVKQNAKQGDLIWDMDSAFSALGFDRADRPDEMIQTMIGIRQLLEDHLMETPGRGACMIVHDPQEAGLVADRIGAELVHCRVDEKERLYRLSLRNDGR